MKMIFLILCCFAFELKALEITPTEKFNQTLSFADDMDFKNMNLAIKRQLKAYDNLGLKGEIRFGTKVYSRKVLRDSLLLFQTLTQKARYCLRANAKKKLCLNRLNKDLNAKFNIYRPLPGKDEAGYSKKQTKFTSYYSPDFNGSRVPTQRFSRAIYRTPNASDLKFTRVEIDYHGALAGKGHEIFWVEESFYDLYLLHVQGGGRIKIHNQDGSVENKYLSYDTSNGLSFQMIHKYMVAQGYITNASVPNQRRYLIENPHKQEEIFKVCPSYIYFTESNEEPVGVHSIPLTEGRSIAMDNRIYKSVGMINFIKAQKITSDSQGVKKPFSRFFITQDTGGAIRGNARCDLYMGYGSEAEQVAYSMNDLGEQYFLIKK